MALRRLKLLLWFVLGVGLATVVARLALGLGTSTNLSHQVSWGIWNAVKISLVPLSAGGFVLAAMVYVFHLERFRPVLRLALLTGFLGYSTFATLLVFDLGVPYRIWHPLVFWQPHSVLFEVAWCVMLYLTVLALEFAPVALERPAARHPVLQTAYRWLKRATIPLVIAGIVLSTLHQSSLGSLFLIAPHRLDALWWSPLLPVVFFVSAVGMGFLVVVVEAFLLGALYRVRIPSATLVPLARLGGATLLLFGALRLGDLFARGVLPGALATPRAPLFGLEILFAVVVPALLLLPGVVRSRRALFGASLAAAFGVALHRWSVALLAIDGGGAAYRPSWMEVALVAGVLAAAALVFLALLEALAVYRPSAPKAAGAPYDRLAAPVATTRHGLRLDAGSAPFGRASMGLLVGIVLGILLLPPGAFGLRSRPTPTRSATTVVGVRRESPTGLARLALDAGVPASAHRPLFLIDGNRNGDAVLFDHDGHADRIGPGSCVRCHHLGRPLDRAPSCRSCHADMFEPASVFGHALHVRALGGNRGCAACHPDPIAAKGAATATPCASCHADLVAEDAFVAQPGPRWGDAPGYYDALHGLCRACHERHVEEGRMERLGRCDTCHDPTLAPRLRALRPGPAATTAARRGAEVSRDHR